MWAKDGLAWIAKRSLGESTYSRAAPLLSDEGAVYGNDERWASALRLSSSAVPATATGPNALLGCASTHPADSIGESSVISFRSRPPAPCLKGSFGVVLGVPEGFAQVLNDALHRFSVAHWKRIWSETA